MKSHVLIEHLSHTSIARAVIDSAADAVKIHLGELDNLYGMADMAKLEEPTPPPFPLCLFELDAQEFTIWVLVDEHDSKLVMRYFVHSPAGLLDTCSKGETFSIDKKTGIGGYFREGGFHGGELESALHSEATTIMTLLAQAFEVIACSNVTFMDNSAPKHLNRKRKAKNKPPISSFKTLHLIVPTSGDVVKGTATGDRTGPRIHLRRGHIRRLPSGQKIWVQAAVVGNKKLGIVNKDYSLSIH